MKTIAVVTGSRAEYGLLKWLMADIADSEYLDLQVIVTGSHLSTLHGYTISEIENDGFSIDYKVEMLLCSDSEVAVSKAIGLGLIGFSDAFKTLKPDLVLVLGDRFEIFAAATAAMVAGIPIAHLHGGEVTEGAFDDSLRHCITKLSHIHFVSSFEYKKRVEQLGEHEETVFNVGGLGVDAISRMAFLSQMEVETALNFSLLPQNLLITWHPETANKSERDGIVDLLVVLADYKNVGLIFSLPNPDPGSEQIRRRVLEFVNSRPNAVAFESLGQALYLSCMNIVDAVVGNSSSGILESPALGKMSLNIGTRQDGRLKARTVIDCKASESDIRYGMKSLIDATLKSGLSTDSICNPYGVGGASARIVKILEEIDIGRYANKRFVDLSSLDTKE